MQTIWKLKSTDKCFREDQQDPMDFFTTITSETNPFPKAEKDALLEPFYLLLQPWVFCAKNKSHKACGGVTIHRFVEISRPKDTDGLETELEEYFQNGVEVLADPTTPSFDFYPKYEQTPS